MDRYFRSKNSSPQTISPLDRLYFVGHTGIGALINEPGWGVTQAAREINLDVLSAHTQSILEGRSDEVLKELLLLNGSSAGARPKARIGVDDNFDSIIHGLSELPIGFEHWIVKFANTMDGQDSGAIEYVYSIMAKNAGVKMPKTHLFPANKGPGYYAVQRFDRVKGDRLHAKTASGLLHSDDSVPALDYKNLISLTEVLTRDVREVERMFRLAVFNVLTHNRDNHSKNFTYLMNSSSEWYLSPAYDLTFSSGSGGEQCTMVLGEGRKPGISDLIELGLQVSIGAKLIHEIIEQTQESLSEWSALARQYGVSRNNVNLVAKKPQSIKMPIK